MMIFLTIVAIIVLAVVTYMSIFQTHASAMEIGIPPPTDQVSSAGVTGTKVSPGGRPLGGYFSSPAKNRLKLILIKDKQQNILTNQPLNHSSIRLLTILLFI